MTTFIVATSAILLPLLLLTIGIKRCAQANDRLTRARMIESDEIYLLRQIGWAAADWAMEKDFVARARILRKISQLGQSYAALLGCRRACIRETSTQWTFNPKVEEVKSARTFYESAAPRTKHQNGRVAL